MQKPTTRVLKSSSLFTSVLVTAALIASPLAMADDSNKRGHHGDRDGKPRYVQMCERLEQGKRHYNREQTSQRMAERHEAVAERLELTDEQRIIWQEIQQERKQQAQARFERMKERCAEKTG